MDYLRVKNWADLQHYGKRRPPWIKSYARLLLDDRFNELSEIEQAQLMKLWLVASQSSRFTVDEVAHKVVPVIVADERSLRTAIRSSRRIPLEKFVNDGWFVRVSEAQLVDESIAQAVQEALYPAETDSRSASTMLAPRYQKSSPLEQRTENIKTSSLRVVDESCG